MGQAAASSGPASILLPPGVMDRTNTQRNRYPDDRICGRRAAVRGLVVGAAGLPFLGCTGTREAHAEPHTASGGPEVTAVEDLMREHGLLQRVLLVYGEAARRMAASEPFDPGIVARAAGIVQRFVEAYHEETEEHHVFPVLERAGRHGALVGVLRHQHDRGRETTRAILAASGANGGTLDLERLGPALAAFERMYRPHAAREDTVVFPAFRETVGEAAYHELGEQFEEDEHRRFGAHGFEDTLAEVARLEEAYAIADLAQFTP
jgi:hemerythrin-like domain-containing protein